MISGAIVSHLTRLGIALPAVVVFACSAAVLALHRNELPYCGRA